MLIENGLNLSFDSIKTIFNGKFIRKSFIDHIYDFRNSNSDINLKKTYKLNGRMSNLEETISYVKKQQKEKFKHVIRNFHYVTLFENEVENNLSKLDHFHLTINNENQYIKLKNDSLIEKEINYLRRKINKFKIWKEKFSNIKEVIEVLNLDDKKYAIQLKEENYLVWKF
jgi:hypothetical protein